MASYDPCTIQKEYGIVWNECNIYIKILILICLGKDYSYAQYIPLKYNKHISNIYITSINLVYIETYLIG